MNLFFKIMWWAGAIAAIYVIAQVLPPLLSSKKDISQVCFYQDYERCFSVELAKTEAERENGLMFRESLDEGKGMLFIFDRDGIYPMWMKNMQIPLDMIWMDKDGNIVFIKENVQPCGEEECQSITPTKRAYYVLEIKSGLVDAYRLEVGNRASFK
ncbi:MAG TPA: DUF192 domain-containing protein [Candidatus Staskawiczbacteria bacterium]|nr:DUF192 domain-containing protein [Candidatus Staskawiczbacteria bacterium]